MLEEEKDQADVGAVPDRVKSIKSSEELKGSGELEAVRSTPG